MIKVRDYELNIDVLEELSLYEWDRVKIKANEMNACSPFRRERSPSFSINTETGLWLDFGATGDFYSKGSLVTLLSFLRNETPFEVEEYLLSKYGIDLSDVDSLSLNINLTQPEATKRIITLDEYRKYAFRHPYLSNRGISEQVQKAFKVGYDKQSKAVALAWVDTKGNIVNIKFRSVKSKQFYYADGQPIRNHIYGMNFIYKMKTPTVYLVESEIDCMYLWSIGKPAIALGGSHLSDVQKQLILRSPLERLVIATDNDSAGEKIKKSIVERINGLKELCEVHLPANVKDVNDLTPDQLTKVADSYTQIKLF